MIKGLIGLAAGALISQVADKPPQYDINQICKVVTQVQNGTGERFAGCVRDETKAKGQVETVWTLAKASTRQTCAGEQGSRKSYVDLVTCMQLYEGSLPWSK